jgi:hypothetical protein
MVNLMRASLLSVAEIGSVRSTSRPGRRVVCHGDVHDLSVSMAEIARFVCQGARSGIAGDPRSTDSTVSTVVALASKKQKWHDET